MVHENGTIKLDSVSQAFAGSDILPRAGRKHLSLGTRKNRKPFPECTQE